MALKVVRKLADSTFRSQVIGSLSSRSYSLYEPDYLEITKSKIPLHDVLNIQIKAYNYCILESYQRFVHNLANEMDIEVETSWALPPQTTHIQRFKPQGTVIDSEYTLKTYIRTIQLVNPPTTLYPILLRMLDASLPQGVTMNVIKHEPEHEEERYIPDKELEDLKTQLEQQGGPVTRKRRH